MDACTLDCMFEYDTYFILLDACLAFAANNQGEVLYNRDLCTTMIEKCFLRVDCT